MFSAATPFAGRHSLCIQLTAAGRRFHYVILRGGPPVSASVDRIPAEQVVASPEGVSLVSQAHQASLTLRWSSQRHDVVGEWDDGSSTVTVTGHIADTVGRLGRVRTFSSERTHLAPVKAVQGLPFDTLCPAKFTKPQPRPAPTAPDFR